MGGGAGSEGESCSNGSQLVVPERRPAPSGSKPPDRLGPPPPSIGLFSPPHAASVSTRGASGHFLPPDLVHSGMYVDECNFRAKNRQKNSPNTCFWHEICMCVIERDRPGVAARRPGWRRADPSPRTPHPRAPSRSRPGATATAQHALILSRSHSLSLSRSLALPLSRSLALPLSRSLWIVRRSARREEEGGF